MIARPVVFFDSGVGGLPYVQAFRRLAPEAAVVYIADRHNFPYGAKRKSELIDILVALVAESRRRWQADLFVLACNTASVTALDALRAAYPELEFVGTVPALKPAALNSAKRRIGVLATERTVRDPYVRLLMDRYAPDCALESIGAPELVDFVERRYLQSTAAEREAVVESYVDKFRSLSVDALVLGCTHFLHLADDFHRLAAPDIAVYDSIDGVARRTAQLWRERSLSLPAAVAAAPEADLYVSGAPPYEASWQQFAESFGLRFSGSPSHEPEPRP